MDRDHETRRRGSDEGSTLDITPILNRQLLTATRKTSLWGARGFCAGSLLLIILSVFGARYYWDRGRVSDHEMMARVALQAFAWMLLAQMGLILSECSLRAVTSIALEKERRTLDFLLATRLGNAEIVLGKLAACMTFLIAGFGAGLPIMLLLHPLGGIDLRLILLAYAGMTTAAFFTIALGICVSTGGTNVRVASAVSVLAWFAWLIGPFFVAMVFPRVGLRLPSFVSAANAWVMASSPLALVFKIAGGATPSSGLVVAVAWMCGLQVAGGALLLLWAIARLRSAFRRSVSGGRQGLAAAHPARLALAPQTPGRRRPDPLEGAAHRPRGVDRACDRSPVRAGNVWNPRVRYPRFRPSGPDRGLAPRLSFGNHQRRAAGVEPGDPVLPGWRPSQPTGRPRTDRV